MSTVSESFGVTPSSSSSSPQNNSPLSSADDKGKKSKLVVTTNICAAVRFKQLSPEVQIPRTPERTCSQPEIES